MGSVPKPDHLHIMLDPKREARRPPEQLWVFVAVSWREAEEVPTIISVLSEIPEAPREYEFEVVRRGDDTFTLEPERWEKPKVEGTLSFFELARQGNVAFSFSEYLEYGSNLIKQYQPDFDYTESEEKAELLLNTLKRVAKVRESVESLRNYLWYSEANKSKAIPPVKEPERDIKAAILQDVFRLGHLRIGEVLNFDDPSNRYIKRENRAVAASIQRGRQLLEYHYGVEGWQRVAKGMRAERSAWLALEGQPKKQMYHLLAEQNRTSVEEEERAGIQDGFDELLDEWLAAWEQDDQRKVESTQAKDLRFERILYRL